MSKIVIKNPRVTEKSALLQAGNVYVFDITKDATKAEIKKAIAALYKVKPLRVNVVTMQKKTIMTRRNTKGVKGGGRKAMVFLKEGDKIEFI